MNITMPNGSTYLIRGPWTPDQLREQFTAFVEKYHSQLTFEQWLVAQGKVYLKQRRPS